MSKMLVKTRKIKLITSSMKIRSWLIEATCVCTFPVELLRREMKTFIRNFGDTLLELLESKNKLIEQSLKEIVQDIVYQAIALHVFSLYPNIMNFLEELYHVSNGSIEAIKKLGNAVMQLRKRMDEKHVKPIIFLLNELNLLNIDLFELSLVDSEILHMQLQVPNLNYTQAMLYLAFLHGMIDELFDIEFQYETLKIDHKIHVVISNLRFNFS